MREARRTATQLKLDQSTELRTTASFGVWPWVELTRRNHVPVERLCDAAGVTMSQLRDPAERFAQSVCNRIAEFAFEQFGPGAAIAAALTVEAGHFQLLELLARTAPTVGEGLRIGAWFFPLLHNGGRIVHELTADAGHALQWHPPADFFVHHGFVELTFAVALLGIRRETRCANLCPREVWFRHGAPADQGLHRQVLGEQTLFDMDEDRVLFDHDTAAERLSRKNADVHKKALGVAKDVLESLRRP